MNTTPIAARIRVKSMDVVKCSGTLFGYASSIGMSYAEKWGSTYINGNQLVATLDRGTLVTWQRRLEVW